MSEYSVPPSHLCPISLWSVNFNHFDQVSALCTAWGWWMWRGGWRCGDVIGQLLEPVQRGQWSARPGWREGSAKVYQFLHNCALVPWVNHFVSAECAMLSPHPRTTYHLTSSVQAEDEAEALKGALLHPICYCCATVKPPSWRKTQWAGHILTPKKVMVMSLH